MLEVNVGAVNIGGYIVVLELADACLDHADAHHQESVPLDYCLQVVVTFERYIGQ